MQVTEVKTSLTAQNAMQPKRQAFFSKEGQGNFFSKSNTALSFFSPATVQPKLTIGQPNDKYEVEADTMADKVVQRLSMNANSIQPIGFQGNTALQTKCAECEQEEQLQEKEEFGVQRKPIFESNGENPEENLQTKSLKGLAVQTKCGACTEEEKVQTKSDGVSSMDATSLERKLNRNKGGGSALAPDIQNSMADAFGANFSKVRIHTGDDAIQMNKELNAQAFTRGNDIYFNQGKYNPKSIQGKHLLAHELTHTIQQKPREPSLDNRIQRTSETFSNCSKTQRIMISNHLSHARTWVDGAMEKLELLLGRRMSENGIRRIANAYASNFGRVNTRDEIMSNLRTIYTNLGILRTGLGRGIEYICLDENRGFAAETSGPLPRQEDFPALRVNGIKIYDIWFQCDYFTRVTTLIHEVAHTDLNIEGDIYETSSSYGNFGWNFSRQNPDSYAVFARQLYHFNSDAMAPGLTCTAGDIMEGHNGEVVQPKMNDGQISLKQSPQDLHIQRQTEEEENPVYRGCTDENTNVRDVAQNLSSGIRRATTMIEAALGLLRQIQSGNADQNVNDLLRLKFGNVRESRIGLIIRNYDSIRQRLNSRSISRGHGIVCVPMGRRSCSTREREGVVESVVGATVCESNRPIYLCASILNDRTGIAETLIHEMAHKIGICAPNGSRELYEHDANFPPRNAEVRNADSYSSFAREAQARRVAQALREHDAEVESAPPNFDIGRVQEYE